MEFKDILAKTFKDLLVWASDPFSECSNRGIQDSNSSSSHGIGPGGGGGDERNDHDDAIGQKWAFMRFVDGLLNRPPPPAPVSPDDIPPYLPKSILRQKSRYPRSPKRRGGRRGRRGGRGGRGGGASGGCAGANDDDGDGAGYAARTSGGGYGGLEGFAGFDGLGRGIGGSGGGGGGGGGGDCPTRAACATATVEAGVRWAPDVAAREKWRALPEVPTRERWWALDELISAPRTRKICDGSISKWTIPPFKPKPKLVPVPEPEPGPIMEYYMPDLRRWVRDAPETDREPLQEPESEVESNAVPEIEQESQVEVEFEAQSLREAQQPALKPTRTVIVQTPRVFSRAARFAAEDDDDDLRNGSRSSGNCPRIGGGNANGGGNTHFEGDCVGNGVIKHEVENEGRSVFGAGGRGRGGGGGGGGGGGPDAWDFMDGGRMAGITLVGINRVKARKARETAELEDFAYDSDDTDDSDEEEEEMEEGGGRGWMSYGYDGSMASLKSVDFSSSPGKNRKRAPCPASGIGLLREIKPSPAQWMTAQQLDEILGSTAGWKNKGTGGGGGGGGGGGRSGRNGFGSGSRMRAKFHQRTGSSGSSSSSGRSSRSNSSSSGSEDDVSREESLLSVKGAGDECKAGEEQKVDEWKVEDVAVEVCGNARFAAELFELAKAEHWAVLLFKRAYLNSQEG